MYQTLYISRQIGLLGTAFLVGTLEGGFLETWEYQKVRDGRIRMRIFVVILCRLESRRSFFDWSVVRCAAYSGHE